MVILVLQNCLKNGFLENRFETLMIFFFNFFNFFSNTTHQGLNLKKKKFEKFCTNMGEIDYATFCPNLPNIVG